MTKIPLLDLKAQYGTIRSEIQQALVRVCESQHFILGPEVAALEKEIATFCGAKHAVGVSSGTDALLVALMAAGVSSGDEVITTPYTFFATAGVVDRLGARCVFVDIEPETFNIDARQVRERITERTRAVIPVHLFGRCADIDPIREAVDGRSITVIEDAAQAIGATDDQGRAAGTMGDMGCFSFFPSKNLGAFGDGGMVVTSDSSLAELLRPLRVHGSSPKYYHPMVGGNFRLDAIQAAVLRVKLPYLESWTERRRENACRYRDLLSEIPKVTLPVDTPGHVYNQFVIRVPERDALRTFLKDNGVSTEVYYPLSLHLQECFRDLGYREGDFPVAEAASRESLALPIYPELTEAQLQQTAELIDVFYRGRRAMAVTGSDASDTLSS